MGGEHLAVVSSEGLEVWNVPRGQCVYSRQLAHCKIAWAPDGQALVAIKANSAQVQVLDAESWQAKCVIPQPNFESLNK